MPRAAVAAARVAGGRWRTAGCGRAADREPSAPCGAARRRVSALSSYYGATHSSTQRCPSLFRVFFEKRGEGCRCGPAWPSQRRVRPWRGTRQHDSAPEQSLLRVVPPSERVRTGHSRNLQIFHRSMQAASSQRSETPRKQAPSSEYPAVSARKASRSAPLQHPLPHTSVKNKQKTSPTRPATPNKQRLLLLNP